MSGKIKIEQDKTYTVIPNDIIKSKTLTWKAKGLMCYLLSNADNWELHKKDLENRSADGYQSMLTAWKELENAGYIESIRIKKGNLFTGYDYIVHRTPVIAVLVNTKDRAHEDQHLISNSKEEVSLFNNVSTNVDTSVGFPIETPTTPEVYTKKVNMSDKCRKFITVFNEVKLIDGKKSQYRFNQKLVNALRDRLKTYSSGEIVRALKNAMLDKYHNETGFMYVTPEYILREKTLEKYLNISTKPKEEAYTPGSVKIDHSSRPL